jgi:hypothetical protein
MYDDPKFWKLPEADRQVLETMTAEEQASYGFGPYDDHDYEEDLYENSGCFRFVGLRAELMLELTSPESSRKRRSVRKGERSPREGSRSRCWS